jgi:hypothetical protein
MESSVHYDAIEIEYGLYVYSGFAVAREYYVTWINHAILGGKSNGRHYMDSKRNHCLNGPIP